MLEIITGYLVLSVILMIIFIEINKEQLYEQYLEIEEEYSRKPSNKWFNLYIFTHFLKAPMLCPMIFLLILGNGGKLLK